MADSLRPPPHAAARLAFVAAIALLGGCAPSDPVERVATDFIQRLFVDVDQARAKEVATGVAVAKLDEEIRLRGDQEIDAETRKPYVTWELIERRGEPDGAIASLVYALHVQPDGVDPFTRQLMLTLRRGDDGWRVGNYTLADSAAPAS
jgi:hypothetical protein